MPVVPGSDRRRKEPGVRTGTMHSFKGLEVARLAAIAANSDNLPFRLRRRSQLYDEVQHDLMSGVSDAFSMSHAREPETS